MAILYLQKGRPYNTKQSLTSSIIPSPSDLEIVSVKIGLGNEFAL